MSKKPIFVTGHKSPDTDSICSALSYAYLKNKLGQEAVAICAGNPNKETQFALDYFNVEQPPVVKDFYVKVKDVMQEIPAVPATADLKEIAAWRKQYSIMHIPVEDAGKFVGFIRTSVLADAALSALNGEHVTVTAGDLAKPEVTYVIAPDTPLHDITGKHCGHLVVVDNDEYLGVVSANAEFPKEKQQVILVDHNEKVQIIDGIDEAEIIENIDHHRIGGLTTANPIFIHYEPVGCTCTIVTKLFRLHGVEIPKHIAGLLLSAIISDTVLYRSPTCTEDDRVAIAYLAEIAGVDAEVYGTELLKAGANVSDFTNEDIVRNDRKEFTGADKVISIAQISVMDTAEVLAKKDELVAALEALRKEFNYSAAYLMITSILAESTDLLYSGDADAIVTEAFGTTPVDNAVFLPNTMSRKKQIVPPIIGAMK